MVVLVGHVDHGKTSLLNVLVRNYFSRPTSFDSQGKDLKGQKVEQVTQEISLKEIRYRHHIFFLLDTPGHGLFSSTREGGGRIADIAVLVISVDRGIEEQTKEVIKIINLLKLPSIVFLNKIDKFSIDSDTFAFKVASIEKGLVELGINPSSLGGETPVVYGSSKKEIGLSDLLSEIEVLNEVTFGDKLVCHPELSFLAVVVNSFYVKKIHIFVQIVIRRGILRKGAEVKVLLSSNKLHSFRVKKIISLDGRELKQADCQMAVIFFGADLFLRTGRIVFAASDNKAEKTLDVYDVRYLKRGADILDQINRRYIESPKKRVYNAFFKFSSPEIGLAFMKAVLIIIKTIFVKKPKEDFAVNCVNCISGSVASMCGQPSRLDFTLLHSIKNLNVYFIGPIFSSYSAEQIKREIVSVRRITLAPVVTKGLEKLTKDLQDFSADTLQPVAVPVKLKITHRFELKNRVSVAGCVVKQGKLRLGDKLSIFRNGRLIVKEVGVSSMHVGEKSISEARVNVGVGILFERKVDFLVGDTLVKS